MNNNLPVDLLLHYYATSMFGWQGIIALFLFLALMALTVTVDSLKWFWLSMLLWFGTFGFLDGNQGHVDRYLVQPFDGMRIFSRLLCFATLVLLLVPLLRSGRNRRQYLVGGATIALFVFQLIFSLRSILSGSIARPFFGVSTYLLAFLTLGLGASQWIQSLPDFFAMLRSLLWGGILLVLTTIITALTTFHAVEVNGRLFGTTNNPQHLGMSLAMLLPLGLFFALRKQESKKWRLISSLFCAVAVLFIIWSGSRSAAIIGILGILLLFRTRIGPMLVATLGIGLAVAIGLELFGDLIPGASHIIATSDSRSEVWKRLAATFMANPLLGVGGEGAAGESSYLAVAATAGIIGLIPLGVMLMVYARQLLRLQRQRIDLSEFSVVKNVVMGWLLCFGVACIFDAYLIGTMTDLVFGMYLCTTLMTFLLDPAIREEFEMQSQHPRQDAFVDSHDELGFSLGDPYVLGVAEGDHPHFLNGDNPPHFF